jgi:Aminotransferase class-V
LLIYATHGLRSISGLRLIGTAKEKASVFSFVLGGFKTEEVGAALNREGIAVRSGHHCAQPSLRGFGVEMTVRPSLALYNNAEDVDALLAALRRLKSLGAQRARTRINSWRSLAAPQAVFLECRVDTLHEECGGPLAVDDCGLHFRERF